MILISKRALIKIYAKGHRNICYFSMDIYVCFKELQMDEQPTLISTVFKRSFLKNVCIDNDLELWKIEAPKLSWVKEFNMLQYLWLIKYQQRSLAVVNWPRKGNHQLGLLWLIKLLCQLINCLIHWVDQGRCIK